VPSSATVLELGAGTGKLTRLLVSRFDRVIAVEPAEAMRRLLVEYVPQAEVLAGAAERVPLAAASVDAVFVAEAFHKFDDERALTEIARVLRPGGALVLLWNVPAGPTEPSIEAAEDFLHERGPDRRDVGYDPLDLNSTRFESGEWRRAFGHAPFEELRELRLPNVQSIDRDGLVAFFASMGWVGDLPDADRLPLLADLRALLDADEYRRSWETRAYRTQLARHPAD
jgi:SAM-dependent methyltransferase